MNMRDVLWAMGANSISVQRGYQTLLVESTLKAEGSRPCTKILRRISFYQSSQSSVLAPSKKLRYNALFHVVHNRVRSRS